MGALDLFHDEDVRYGERLRDAGVACQIVTVESAYHGFDVLNPGATVSHQFETH